jgi:hypothetical protein
LLNDPDTKLGIGELYTECGYVNAIEFLRDSHRYDEVSGSGSLEEFCARDFLVRMNSPLTGNKYFATSDGRAGIGPPGTQVNDVVCVFNGGKVPYLVGLGEVQGTVTLVCQDYVQAIMFGEMESLGLQEDEFVLV